MSVKEHLKIVTEQLIELGNLEVLDVVFSANYLAHADGKEYHGHDFLKRFTKQMRTALPDLKVLKYEILLETENSIN